MTRQEFISKVPGSIEHKLYGHGKLIILSDVDGIKGAWYRHENLVLTGKSFGQNWDDVYNKLSQYLKEEGFNGS